MLNTSYYTGEPTFDEILAKLYSIQCINEANISASQKERAYARFPDKMLEINKESVELQSEVTSLQSKIRDELGKWNIWTEKTKKEMLDEWTKKTIQLADIVMNYHNFLADSGLLLRRSL